MIQRDSVSKIWLDGDKLSAEAMLLFQLLGHDQLSCDLLQASRQLEMLEPAVNSDDQIDDSRLGGDLLAVASRLGMMEPSPLPENLRPNVDVGVVPGGKLIEMRYGLLDLLKQNWSVPQILLLPSQRPLDRDEVAFIGRSGFMPFSPTEADAAEFILFQVTFSPENKMRSIVALRNETSRSSQTLEEAAHELIGMVDGEPTVLVALQQPYALRTMLTFINVMARENYCGDVYFTAAAPMKSDDRTGLHLDGRWTSVLREEACGIVSELAKVCQHSTVL